GKPVFSSTALRQRRLERCAILRVACPISAARLHDRLSIVKPGTREVSPRGTPRADTRALGGIGPWAGHRHLCRAAGAARTGPVQFVLRCAIGAILERRAPRALKTFSRVRWQKDPDLPRNPVLGTPPRRAGQTVDWSGTPGSNRRPSPWQGDALPAELVPRS